jgi:hypothetical protein
VATVSDDFNRADSTTLGSNWTGTWAGQIVSNAITLYGSGGGNYGAGWNADTFSGNQYAQITIVQLPTNEYAAGVAIRGSSDSNLAGGFCYGCCVRSDGAVRLVRNASVVYTSSAGAFSNGDVLRLEDRGGGNIVIVKNGTDYYTGYTDGAPLTGTYIGIFGWYFSSGANNFICDDWEGGDLGAAPSFKSAWAINSNQVIQ